MANPYGGFASGLSTALVQGGIGYQQGLDAQRLKEQQAQQMAMKQQQMAGDQAEQQQRIEANKQSAYRTMQSSIQQDRYDALANFGKAVEVGDKATAQGWIGKAFPNTEYVGPNEEFNAQEFSYTDPATGEKTSHFVKQEDMAKLTSKDPLKAEGVAIRSRAQLAKEKNDALKNDLATKRLEAKKEYDQKLFSKWRATLGIQSESLKIRKEQLDKGQTIRPTALQANRREEYESYKRAYKIKHGVEAPDNEAFEYSLKAVPPSGMAKQVVESRLSGMKLATHELNARIDAVLSFNPNADLKKDPEINRLKSEVERLSSGLVDSAKPNPKPISKSAPKASTPSVTGMASLGKNKQYPNAVHSVEGYQGQGAGWYQKVNGKIVKVQ